MAGRTTYTHLRRLLSLWRPALNLALAAGLLAQDAACSRPFYRKRADEEVAEVLGQKDKYPDWKIDNWHVYPDPLAVAKQGPAHGQEAATDKTGPSGPEPAASVMTAPTQRDAIAVAKERSPVDISGRPTYMLTLEQAAELAMFNSREYQDQR